MPATPPFPSLAERHDASRRHYLDRDLATYMSAFAPDLVYRQADGKALTLEGLTRQVAHQLRSLGAADWTSTIDAEERDGERVVETVTQRGWFAATAFGVLHRLWLLDRQSRYLWKVHEGRWRIGEATVLREKLTDLGFQLGLRPRPPSMAPYPDGAARR